MKPKMGLILPTGFKMDLPSKSPYEEISKVAVSAENLGYHYLWSFDHLLTFPDPSYAIFEPWSILPALARDTKTIRLGTLVSCSAFRNPGMMAKIAVTVDFISQGRVELGIGAGWWQPEFLQFGFETFSFRAALFDEYIQILNALLSGKEVTFKGRFFKLSGAKINPLPIQKPTIPIWVGATRPKMLEIISKHASRWNMRGTPEYYTAECERLDKNLLTAGRKPQDLTRSVYVLVGLVKNGEEEKALRERIYHTSTKQATPTSKKLMTGLKHPDMAVDYLRRRTGRMRIDDPVKSDIIGTADECLNQLSKYVDLGVEHLFVYLVGCNENDTLESFTDKVVNRL